MGCAHRDRKVSLMFVHSREFTVTERRVCVGDRAAERGEHDAGGESSLGRESSNTSPAEGCPFFLFIVFPFLKALGVKSLDFCVRKIALVNLQLELSVSTHTSQKLIDQVGQK